MLRPDNQVMARLAEFDILVMYEMVRLRSQCSTFMGAVITLYYSELLAHRLDNSVCHFNLVNLPTPLSSRSSSCSTVILFPSGLQRPSV